MFSTRVTGIEGRRSAVASGMAELPTLTSSSALPSHAASICLRSIPASATASVKASTIKSSEPMSQRSPNAVQPIPAMTTRSRIPVAISALHDRPLGGRRLPEIAPEPAPAIDRLDAEAHPHLVADGEAAVGCVAELHQHPRAIGKL